MGIKFQVFWTCTYRWICVHLYPPAAVLNDKNRPIPFHGSRVLYYWKMLPVWEPTQGRMPVLMNVNKYGEVEWVLAGETKYSEKNRPQYHFSIPNTTWLNLGSNLGVCGRKITNGLSYNAVSSIWIATEQFLKLVGRERSRNYKISYRKLQIFDMAVSLYVNSDQGEPMTSKAIEAELV